MTEDPASVARLFHELAPVYDTSGVDYFRPMARRLVELLAPRPGERALDIGCGRGAVSVPLADAVGPRGAVTAADIVPAMLEALSDDALRLGLRNLSTILLDASAPAVPMQTYDLVAAAAVLPFLPDPREALSRWLRLLKPGGRIGVTTFGAQDPTWSAVDSLFTPFKPAGALGTPGPSGCDPAPGEVAALLASCGGVDVHTHVEPVRLTLVDAEQWRTFTMTTPQLRDWQRVPPAERDRLFARAGFLLESARDHTGRIVLTQQIHYTLGRRPRASGRRSSGRNGGDRGPGVDQPDRLDGAGSFAKHPDRQHRGDRRIQAGQHRSNRESY